MDCSGRRGAAGLSMQVGMQGRVPATRALLTRVNESEKAFGQLKPVFEQVADPREYLQGPGRLNAGRGGAFNATASSEYPVWEPQPPHYVLDGQTRPGLASLCIFRTISS